MSDRSEKLWRSSPRIELLEPSPELLLALTDGKLEQARDVLSFRLGACFVEPGWRRLWLHSIAQMRHDPLISRWIMRIILDVDLGLAVGRAGFYGRPDHEGVVEVGYAVDPNFRRRGYARAALQRLLLEADADREVLVVRACVRPDDVAARALLADFGFLEVGEHWDEEDGFELGFETPSKFTGG